MFPLAITGCQVLTALDVPGDNSCPACSGTWEAILAGRHAASTTRIDDRLLAGEPDFDRSIRLALAVAGRALKSTPFALPPDGLFCATSKGPVGIMLAAAEKVRRSEPLSESEALHVALGPAAMGAVLGQHLKLPHLHTSIAACASGAFALHRAAQAIWRGECSRALVVAADSSLHPVFEASFARLGVLAPTGADGTRRCEPFGTGDGFFISEAAAAMVLQKPDSTTPLAWLEASWIGGDGISLVAGDPRAITLRRGLEQLRPQNITDSPPPNLFVHAHATGTSHDPHELAAIRATLGKNVPVFSHKGYLGHSLGAASLVAGALSALCHAHSRTPTAPIAPGSHSLTIAQGFGGHVVVTRMRS